MALSVVHAQVATPDVIAFPEQPEIVVSLPATVCLNVTVPTAPAGVMVADKLLRVLFADEATGNLEFKTMLVVFCVTATDIGDALEVP